MARAANTQPHVYSLLVDEDASGNAQRIEIEGTDASAAMQFAQRAIPEREIELLEDGQSLGKMKCTREGYWIVRPQASPSQAARSWRSPSVPA